MSNYRGMGYLRGKLATKASRNKKRYKYYEMKNRMIDISNVIPKEFRWLTECLGWCTKTVDVMADRLSVVEFGNDLFNMQEIYNMNNPDVLFDSAIISSLITSCSFIYISQVPGQFPRLQVIDGTNATGIIDPITNMLIEGYAVLERDTSDNPTKEAYFIKGVTYFYEKGKKPYIQRNIAPYPLLVPIIYRPDAKRPFGHSRITRACMSIQQGAMRTLKRGEVAAEFYSFPQKYILGLANDVEFDKWKATISSFIQITEGENGEKPTVGQFQQQSMTPFVEQLRMSASLFAGETGLTLDDLGFPSENPSSNEAIKSQHENLRLAARKAQKTFTSGFINAGYLAACLRDGYPYERNQIYSTTLKWAPIFEPDAATLSSIGDGAIKINQAVPGYFGKENLKELTGINYSQDASSTPNLDDMYKDDLNE
ncbi:Phage portal protein%2C SPP1 Gp6-like [uncultured Clostridium sp.]|nr:Phage portal protein%2C SPP1 Gp6-like [uncultured Clostridium sp.]